MCNVASIRLIGIKKERRWQSQMFFMCLVALFFMCLVVLCVLCCVKIGNIIIVIRF